MYCPFLLLIAVLLAGCHLSSTDLATQITRPGITPTIATLLAHDAAEVVEGICFEAALDAAGQVFILRDAEEHIRFYNLADNSQLCRRPVERIPFDFSNGHILVGMWSAGSGCTARHEIKSMNRDDEAKTVSIQLSFVTEGDCPYELVRPFWRALDDVADYEIELQVVE